MRVFWRHNSSNRFANLEVDKKWPKNILFFSRVSPWQWSSSTSYSVPATMPVRAGVSNCVMGPLIFSRKLDTQTQSSVSTRKPRLAMSRFRCRGEIFYYKLRKQKKSYFYYQLKISWLPILEVCPEDIFIATWNFWKPGNGLLKYP